LGVVALSLGLSYAVLAWTEPSLVPPGCVLGTPGCDAPLNVSAALQTKQGQLVLNANSLLTPALIVNKDAYFLNGKVGIGTTDPQSGLEVYNGVRLTSRVAADRPACDANKRGTLWFTQGAAGVKDSMQVCAKDAANVYAWRTLY